MFKIKVFKITDLIKYFIELIMAILIIFIITKTLFNNKQGKSNEETNAKSWSLNYDLTGCIDVASGIIKETNHPEETEIKAYESNLFEDILKSQIGAVEDFTGIYDDENTSNEKQQENDNKNADESNTEDNSNNQSSELELAKTRIKDRSYNKKSSFIKL